MKKGDPVVRTSKWLSLILRHDPGKIGLTLDRGGWASLDELLRKAPPWVTRDAVVQAVTENDKQRFTIKDGRIRANQGHSIEVELDLVAVEPPEFLYHGTYHKVVDLIWAEGLRKMARHHVHMAAETGTAVTVGRRSGTPVVFKILAAKMHAEGFIFYRSDNGVWLTEHVPPTYLERLP